MNDQRRRFSSRERVALYLTSDGRCANCGVELEPGWHSDHVTPWSAGGPTDVVNGQPLCPRCNLEKGDHIVTLRVWQEEALRQFLTSGDDFLCVATPAAGKTRFALAAGQQLWDRGEIRRLVVVVPTSHLRAQWAGVAHQDFGLQLDPNFQNRHGAPARDFDGAVVTYSAVASEPLVYRRWVSQEPTLVVLDEIHHAGEPDTWGKKLREAFEPAARRLLLSGTPFRTHGTPIPFVNYDHDGLAQADVKYDYGLALADGIVRPVSFPAFDGETRWRQAGDVYSTDLSEADEDTVSKALAAALDPDGEWIGSVLREADQELARQREVVSDAGGLVVAADQYKARRYAALLQQVSGEPVALAISDEPDASGRIAEFTRGRSRWLVAVQMVSEGVDIPRLAVGVYASNYQTRLFFLQVTGRFLRVRGNDETCATLYVPSVQKILGYAAEIERLVPPALHEAVERASKEGHRQLLLNLVEQSSWEPAGSSEAVHFATILSGTSVPDVELRRAEQAMQLVPGLPPSLTPAQAALMLRAAGAGQVVGTAEVKMPSLGLADQKKALRKKVQSKVNQYARERDAPYSHVHSELNRECGEPNIHAATVDTLHRRLDVLDRWLGQG